jgi:pyruvate/2-oxoglutarate dehydrogenase complex dihydrolipoamide acyltransferase (E2) component
MTALNCPEAGASDAVPFDPERTATLDTLRWAMKRMAIPVLLEMDVTCAREAIRAGRKKTGKRLSFTAWVISCVARAAAEHPRVHAIRRGKRQLILFRQVDVAVVVERLLGIGSEDGPRETLPMPAVIRKANEKSAWEIHDELRRAQTADVATGAVTIERGAPLWLQSVFWRLPCWLRDLLLWRWLLRSPQRMKRTMGTVMVTSTGMMAPGVLAWGIPLSLHPLAVGVGGIAQRSTAAGKAEILALTLAFDHAVIDGAPFGRFVHRLHELMSRGEGITEVETPGSGHG